MLFRVYGSSQEFTILGSSPVNGSSKATSVLVKGRMEQRDYFVHASSYVDDPCSIGTGTKVWHFSHVMKNAQIGVNCNIGQNVVISPDVVIGNNVKIQNNVSVYTGCILEDDVFCGPSMVFTNVVNPRSHIVRKDEYKTTLVRKGATLGANCTVVCGTTIGRYAFVGAGSVVTHDIPDYALVYGNPARTRGWMCGCGIRLEFSGKGSGKCQSCGAEYVKSGEQIQPIEA
jgi:UDP-2-acetamido-3-amino-2,3-dideoxy-glucuronate N-acetyltransferase